MKTLKEVRYQKIVIWSLVVMFSFLQVVPTGWAATRPGPVDELQGQSVSSTVDALGNSPAPAKPVSASPQAIGFVDSTAFQLNDHPLSLVKSEPTPVEVGLTPEPNPIDPGLLPEPVPTPISLVVTAVKANLVKNLGITATQLEAWLKEGLIKIGNGSEKGTVLVSFSEQLRSQYDSLKSTNLFDPTGASGLPKSIEYHYVSLTRHSQCSGTNCPADSKVVLDSSVIRNWDGTLGVAKYSAGALQQVDWYRNYRADEIHPMMVCEVANGPTCGMVKDRTVTYNMTGSTPEYRNPAYLLVTVVYHDGRVISKLVFEIGKMADGQDHILKAREYNKEGKLVVINEFQYLVAQAMVKCLPNTKCVAPPALVQLESIVRKDANGNLLSTIQNIRKSRDAYILNGPNPPSFLGGYIGDVVVGGQVVVVGFKDLNNLLEQVRKLEELGSVPPVVTEVKANLLKNLGITATQLEAWLKEGLIKIGYGDAKGIVTVSFSETLRSQYDSLKNTNLFDPTGASGLPKSIEYHYVGLTKLSQCSGTDCSSGSKVMLDSAIITNWDGTVGIAKYAARYPSELQQVDWYRQPRSDEPVLNRMCGVADGPSCGMVKDRTVTYSMTGSTPEFPNPENLNVSMIYHDGRAIPRLEFYVGTLADGQDHILRALEYNKDGKLIVSNEFNYLVAQAMVKCLSNAKCVAPPALVQLESIVRKDANGNLLSTIQNIRKSRDAYILNGPNPPSFLGGYIGDVVVGGQVVAVGFKDLNNLLEQVRKLEELGSVPPVVKTYLDALKKALGTGYVVNATLQANGTYLVNVGRSNSCSGPDGLKCLQVAGAPGTFGSLQFSISKDGIVNRDSVKANYNGVEVDGKLLFDAMSALEASFHSVNSEWMPPPQMYIARLVELASQITVKEASASLLRFDHNGKSYKAVRDANGNIKLEAELPPAVQTYVKELQEKVGKGFEVTAVLQKDGTYLIRITDSKAYEAFCPTGGTCDPTGRLQEMSYKLQVLEKCSTLGKCELAGLVVDSKSLQVHYYNKKEVDVPLLYEGLIKLQNYCAPGMNCPMVYRSDPRQAIVDMTRITLISAGKGVIQFTLGSKSYRVYRDASGTVILEEELPSAVQGYVDALKNRLGTGFNVTTTLQADGTYFVHVGRANTCPEGAYCVSAAPGTFGSLQFRISKDGIVNRDFIKANYNDGEVNGKMLFEAMGALEASFHSEGSQWMPPPQTYIALLVERATQIRVTESGTNLLRFDHAGKSYKVSRDASGKVILEEELPRAVQAYVDALKNSLGAGFKVTATLQRDGTYFVHVGRTNTCPQGAYCVVADPAPGTFGSMGFSLSKDGIVNRDSVKADYNGVKLDGKLLLDAMAALEASFHPQGSEWMPPPQGYIAALVKLATQIHVTESGTNLLRFELNGKSYKVSRDASGKVILEEELPPAVQTYVKELQEKVGKGFEVTAVLQRDGSYLISITDSKKYSTSQTPTSGLKEMSFKFKGVEGCFAGSKCEFSGFEIDPASLRVIYYTQNPDKVMQVINAQLLFEGLMKLQNYCAPGMNCPLVYRSDSKQAIVDMTRITAISTDEAGAIHFSIGNKNYKTYRDAKGNVILEEALPPAVQAYVDALKNRLGTGFNVTATLQANGTYHVQVGRSNKCSGPDGLKCLQVAGAPGIFGSLLFSISKDGIVTRDFVKANYNGVEVDGKLLFDAMAALEVSFHSQGSEWMPPPQIYIALLVERATQIHVTESGTNLLRFDHNGKSYKAVRDANGNVKLEAELPPAVQAYVKELQGKVGKGFEVTAVLQKDGAYLFNVTDSKRYAIAPKGGLKTLSFKLQGLDKCIADSLGKCGSAGFVVDPKSLQVQYYSVGYGKVAIDAPLLYEGLMKLQNYCAPGMNCPMVYRSDPQQAIADMTRITAISSGKGLIQFTLGAKSYRTYRDAKGNVIIEVVTPPLIVRPVAKKAMKVKAVEKTKAGSITLVAKSRPGTGFSVTATLQANGAYLVNAGRIER